MLGELFRARVLKGLNSLAQRDHDGIVFGSLAHRYRLNSPLGESELNAFEHIQGIALPADYRYFITQIGNGGAGPYYGLFPFGVHDHNAGFCKWEVGYLVGDFSKEFAHTEAWNLPQSILDQQPKPTPNMSAEEVDQLSEQWDRYVNEHYWTGCVFNGAIPVCHRGCALREWLVIHGPQRGYVWGDERADYKGIYPLRDAAGAQMTFSNWYLSWLSSSMQTLSRK